MSMRAASHLGQFAVTCAVVSGNEQRCRLVVKLLVAWPDHALSSPLRRLLPMADLFIMRKQLLTLKRLAERDALTAA
jgi:hypothetical protein